MQIVRDNLHEMSTPISCENISMIAWIANPFFLENYEQYIKMSSAEFLPSFVEYLGHGRTLNVRITSAV